MVRRGLWVAISLIILMMLTSCGMLKGVSPSGDIYAWIDGEKMNVSELPNPKTHTLVYGGLEIDFGDGVQPITRNGRYFFQTSFIQLNQKRRPMILEPVHLSDSICFLPVTPGMHFKLVQARLIGGNRTTYYPHRMQGEGISFIAKKPGLQYIGGYKFIANQIRYAENKDYKEINALRAMQEIFKNTEWLPLIEARIVELGYPKEEKNEK